MPPKDKKAEASKKVADTLEQLSLDQKPKVEVKGVAEEIAPVKEVVSSPVKEITKVEYKPPEYGAPSVEVKNEVKEIEKKFFHQNPIRLFVDYSHTIPMRPYESAKISIGLSIPIGVEIPKDLEERIAETYKYASAFIDVRMEEEIRGINEYVAALKK